MQMKPWRRIKELFGHSDAPSAAKQEKGRENRSTIRRPQRLVQGYIWSDRMAFPKECTIRDLSITGARIDLRDDDAKAHMLIGTLTLYFPADKQEIDCQVVWRVKRSMGLRFIGTYRAPTRRYGA
jgi:hypothetical protein